MFSWFKRPKKAKKGRRYPPGSNPPLTPEQKARARHLRLMDLPSPGPPRKRVDRSGDRLVSAVEQASEVVDRTESIFGRYERLMENYHRSHVRILQLVREHRQGKITDQQFHDSILEAIVLKDSQ